MTSRTTDRFLKTLVGALALLAMSVAGPLAAQGGSPADRSDARGSSINGAAGGRDNTRVKGVVFDSQGNPYSSRRCHSNGSSKRDLGIALHTL